MMTYRQSFVSTFTARAYIQPSCLAIVSVAKNSNKVLRGPSENLLYFIHIYTLHDMETSSWNGLVHFALTNIFPDGGGCLI